MKLEKFKLLFLLLFVGMAFVSCSDDNDGDGDDKGGNGGNDSEITVNDVFKGGVPKSVGDIQSIALNDKGQVTEMITSDAKVTFQYATVKGRSTGKKPTVVMTVNYGDGEYDVLNMMLGNNSFVESVEETSYSTYDGTYTSTWQFKYNSKGQVCYMNRSEGGNEETFITYDDGDITHVKMTSDENEEVYESNILYTSGTFTAPIENKGCIMLFDATFSIDMDEMRYAYYAGLLGYATKHLPVGIKNNYGTEYYDWTLNADGYPVSVIADYDKCIFKW